MKIVFMGTPEFSVPILEALNNKYEVVLVISQPNRAKKKNQIVQTPVAAYASSINLNLIQPEKIKEEYEYIKSLEADMLITAAYGQIIPTKILNLFKKCINVHASLLPKKRGGAPIQRALIEGDEKTGVTIMEMVKALDAGKIFAVKEYTILDEDNNTSLFEKLSYIGRDLLMESIEDIYNDVNKGIPQDDSQSTYSANIDDSELKIDITRPARQIVNLIRGLSFEPGAYLEINDIKLKVFKASVISDNSDNKPGVVLKTKKGIVIKAGDDAISLDLVLMPGKKMLSGQDFSNGQKLFELGKSII